MCDESFVKRKKKKYYLLYRIFACLFTAFVNTVIFKYIKLKINKCKKKEEIEKKRKNEKK